MATFAHGVAQAQDIVAPPKDAEALVAHPKESATAPTKEDNLDGTTITASAGGQLSTGNSQAGALSGSAKYETRFHDNSVGLDVLGNYSQSAPPGGDVETTVQNVQGRARYDRFLTDAFGVFVLNTGRHDWFQGLRFRYNLDPGVKYIFLQQPTTQAWGELGYDMQFDVRTRHALHSTPPPDDQSITKLDHSIRAFVGFKHAFNDAVTFNTGIEYLQSVVESTRYRVNYEALLAAKLWGGLALGAGFNLRYDHHPVNDSIKNVDTQTVLSIIYSYSSAAPPPKSEQPAPCPPAPACPTTPADVAPAPAPAPAPMPSPDANPPPDTMAPPTPAPPSSPPPGATPNTPPTTGAP